MKRYAATLTQSGTNNPIAVVLENTFGAEIVWERETAGRYNGNLADAFPSGQTIPLMPTTGDPANTATLRTAVRNSDSQIQICTNFEDGVLNGALGDAIVIEVYPE